MKRHTSRIAALAVVGALAMTGLGAQAASADPIGGTSPVPAITLTPTTGSASTDPMLTRLQTNVGCPVGFRGASIPTAFQNGEFVAAIGDAALADTAPTDGSTGLNGAPIDLNRDINPSNDRLSNGPLSSKGLQAGDWELRVYCIADLQALDFATDKWIALPMTLDAAGTWAVKGAVVNPPTAAATTTSLTAAPNQTAKTVTLTATVKKADGTTAADATGAVQFTQNGANVGTPVTVANGLASYTTAALADGTYSFTSVFAPTGTVYAGSTSSAATATITTTVVVPPGAQTDTAVIDVTVPSNTGAVSFAGLRDTISLGTAVLETGLFKASGALGPIVVTDTRQLGSTPWSLTGTVSNFTTTDGKILDGKYLGWVPALVGSPNAGTAGPAVAPAPATVAGLKAPASVLSSGSVVDGATTTTVDAALNLIAPGNTPGGFYTSTLTLTLVS